MNSIASEEPSTASGNISPKTRLEKENQKIKNNNKLLFYFEKHKLIDVDG